MSTSDRTSSHPLDGSSAPPLTSYRGLSSSLRTPSFSPSTNPASPLRYPTGLSSHGNPDDVLVLEVGAKFLRAGFASHSHPRCVLAWNKGMFKRSGDKAVLGEVMKRRGTELWRPELRGLNFGLVEDLLERGLREAYHKYLLIDSKTRKLILTVPPLFPTHLLTSLIATIFSHFHPPSMTLLPAPVLATVAAGLRSALVVDIGWYETVVTPVYDLRAIEGRGIGVYGRSKRGVKCLRKQWVRLLTPHYRRAMGLDPASSEPSGSATVDADSDDDEKVSNNKPNLNDVSEAMERLGWCRPLAASSQLSGEDTYRLTKIPLPSSSTSVTLPFSDLAIPAERAFFAPTTEDPQAPLPPSNGAAGGGDSDVPTSAPEICPDDDDIPLPRLLYNVLLRCTVDVRAKCLPRIVFVGGGSNVPGLQTRTVEELQNLIDTLRWNISPGARLVTKTTAAGSESTPQTSPSGSHGLQEAYRQQEGYDWHGTIRDDNNDRSVRQKQPGRQSEGSENIGGGRARAVKSLGVWAGGSLVGGLRIKGRVELDREKFLTAVGSGGTGLPAGTF